MEICRLWLKLVHVCSHSVPLCESHLRHRFVLQSVSCLICSVHVRVIPDRYRLSSSPTMSYLTIQPGAVIHQGLSECPIARSNRSLLCVPREQRATWCVCEMEKHVCVSLPCLWLCLPTLSRYTEWLTAPTHWTYTAMLCIYDVCIALAVWYIYRHAQIQMGATHLEQIQAHTPSTICTYMYTSACFERALCPTFASAGTGSVPAFIVFCADSVVLYVVRYQHCLRSYGSTCAHSVFFHISSQENSTCATRTVQRCVCECSVKSMCPLLHHITEAPAFTSVCVWCVVSSHSALLTNS